MTDKEFLNQVLVLTLAKGFWASTESRIFPNICYMKFKWGHSSLWRNSILFFFQAVFRIWRTKPKLIYFGACGRIIFWLLALKRCGVLKNTKFLTSSHIYLNKRNIRFFDRIIVQSTSAIRILPSKYRDRCRFIPHPANGDFSRIERVAGDYVFAGGGAGRDFKTLIEAVSGTSYPLKIVSFSRDLLEYPSILPENVEFFGRMPLQNFLTMIAQSRLVVIPLKKGDKPHGHVSIIQALVLGKAVISTRNASCEDYFKDGKNALLVDPGDVQGYRHAIEQLFHNEALRHTLERNAQESARRFTYSYFAKEAVKLCEELLSSDEQGVVV